MRAHQLGYQVPPGGKIRYVVVNVSASEPLERVVLAEELPSSATISACASHYNTLAERAVWAILAPFGWSEEDLRGIGRQPTLYEFIGLHAATPAIQPKQETFDEVRIGE
jgi:DNA polymerase elongation subunit (family B)